MDPNAQNHRDLHAKPPNSGTNRLVQFPRFVTNTAGFRRAPVQIKHSKRQFDPWNDRGLQPERVGERERARHRRTERQRERARGGEPKRESRRKTRNRGIAVTCARCRFDFSSPGSRRVGKIQSFWRMSRILENYAFECPRRPYGGLTGLCIQ